MGRTIGLDLKSKRERRRSDYVFHQDYRTRCTSKSDRIGLVANSYCDYFGSAQYPGVLDVGLRVVKLGKSSVVYEVGVFQQGEEKVKAVGGFTQIWVKREDNKVDSEGVPRHIREEMAKLVNSEDSDVVKPSKL
ncbi:hypothetical protein LTR51_000021 [Lithohypha guttulata]|nr:hypothetical protein LTR51_000021 [Lithohypha guttulata]